MLLSHDDAAQFFRLMWGLQWYVNQQRQLLPGVSSYEAYAALDSSRKVIVRDALWEHPDLIDAYLQANPDKLSEGELTLISKWKGFIAGKFYIFRYLKDHAIFLGDSQVYGVKGLSEPLDVVFQGRPLPILVETVLLPYKGQIVYDGLCRTYNIYFGGNIRRDLKEQYLAAKQNGRIQISLEAEANLKESFSGEHELARGSDKAVSEIVQRSERLRGGSPVQGATFGVLRASARVAEVAVSHPTDLAEIQRMGRQVYMALKRLEKTLERAEWR